MMMNKYNGFKKCNNCNGFICDKCLKYTYICICITLRKNNIFIRIQNLQLINSLLYEDNNNNQFTYFLNS